MIDQATAVLTRLDGRMVRVENAAQLKALDPPATTVIASKRFPLDAATLLELPALRAVVIATSGTDAVDITAAEARGLTVIHKPGDEITDGMAEATIMLILAASYGLGRWMGAGKGLEVASSLSGKQVGLIGLGRIALAVARRLSTWDLRVAASSARPGIEAPAGVNLMPLEELLATSHVVSLHVALTAETRGLIGTQQIGLMRRDAVLVNTSRGGVLDEDAVARALREGRIRAAALDVFDAEPLPDDSPLRTAPNIILTPHRIGHTAEGEVAMERMVVDALSTLVEIGLGAERVNG